MQTKQALALAILSIEAVLKNLARETPPPLDLQEELVQAKRELKRLQATTPTPPGPGSTLTPLETETDVL